MQEAAGGGTMRLGEARKGGGRNRKVSKGKKGKKQVTKGAEKERWGG